MLDVKNILEKIKPSSHKIASIWLWIVLMLVVILSVFIILKKCELALKFNIMPYSYQQVEAEAEIKSPYSQALSTPNKVKGIYMTGYTFSSKKRRNELIHLIETTELNAVVIDFKDPIGKLMFTPILEPIKDWPVSPASLTREDYKNILSELQVKNIYTIARVTTFQDPTAVKYFTTLALKNKNGGNWVDYKGMTWLDMTNSDVWRLVATEAKEAALVGFDEVQFDYIRFPSDGNTRQIEYRNFTNDQKKYKSIVEFFRYLKTELEDLPIPLSIDLFGLTYQRHSNLDYDLNIGQRLSDASLYFNYISPMVYPSHYPKGFLSFSNPASHPYEVVNKALSEGNLILESTTSSMASTRPWLQDFDLGADYNADMVKAQIRAADENNTSGWLLWNASNRYTESVFEIIDK